MRLCWVCVQTLGFDLAFHVQEWAARLRDTLKPQARAPDDSGASLLKRRPRS